MKENKETCVLLVSKYENEFLADNKGFLDHIIERMSMELARRVMEILNTEGEIIVKQSDLRVSDYMPPDSIEYRKQIVWSKLVQCKYCKYFDGQELCNRHFIFVGNDTSFFCKDGKWKDDPSHPFADDVMMGERRE